MQIEVAGIPVEIQKKDIKNLHLYVLPPDGAVRVSAPESFSDESIRLFVRSRLGWIKKKQEQFNLQPRQTQRQYVSGETMYVWGKQYFLLVNYSSKGNSLVLNGDRAILTVRKESTPSQRENYVNEWYRKELKAKIEQLLPKWEQKTGLFCSSWQTKYMTTKWGTCNTKTGKIWINLQLTKKTIDCLEYVILHELTHLKIRNHGKDFVAFMDSNMPYWRDIRRTLNGSIMDHLAKEKLISEQG